MYEMYDSFNLRVIAQDEDIGRGDIAEFHVRCAVRIAEDWDLGADGVGTGECCGVGGSGLFGVEDHRQWPVAGLIVVELGIDDDISSASGRAMWVDDAEQFFIIQNS